MASWSGRALRQSTISRASPSRCRRPARSRICWRAPRSPGSRSTLAPCAWRRSAAIVIAIRLCSAACDAAVVSNEYLPLPSSRSLKMLVEGKDALPNFVRICIFSTGKVLSARREDAIRYLTAQSKALRYALSHRDETIKLTVEATDAKPDDPRPAFVFDDAVKTQAIAPELPLPMDRLAWIQQQLLALGQIPKAGDLAKLVDSEPRAAALQRTAR